MFYTGNPILPAMLEECIDPWAIKQVLYVFVQCDGGYVMMSSVHKEERGVV